MENFFDVRFSIGYNIQGTLVFMDRNGNSWDYEGQGFKEMQNIARTLLRCYQCYQCYDCIDCVDCRVSTELTNCAGLTGACGEENIDR